MKVTNRYDNYYPNAYDFDKHVLTDFEEETEVEAIPAKLILHEKGWSE